VGFVLTFFWRTLPTDERPIGLCETVRRP
jgi:hypothetical protein